MGNYGAVLAGLILKGAVLLAILALTLLAAHLVHCGLPIPALMLVCPIVYLVWFGWWAE